MGYNQKFYELIRNSKDGFHTFESFLGRVKYPPEDMDDVINALIDEIDEALTRGTLVELPPLTGPGVQSTSYIKRS